MSSILDTHTAIIGTSGAGKTVTAKGYVEQLLADRRHLCVLDPTSAWWGLRSNAAGDGPGFDIPIFGGPHADIPITADQGDAIAAIVADGVSAIIDISGMRNGADQRRFTRDLFQRLRAKPDGNFHLIVDEADEFAAQKPRDDFGFGVAEELIWMAKRGRLPGFVLTLITQRPASIDKEVLTQAQTLIVHQLIAPVDQKPVVDYLKDHASREVLIRIKGSLASLDRGERWVYSPRLGVLERGVSPLPATFDSSRTPAPGERVAAPKMLASIDLAAIRMALEVGSKVEAACVTEDDRDRKIADLIRANAECADLITEQLDEIARITAERDRIQVERDLFNGQIEAAIRALGVRPLDEIAEAIEDRRWANGLKLVKGAGSGVEDNLPPHSRSMGSLRPASAEARRPATLQSDSIARNAGPRDVPAPALNTSARKLLDMLERIAPARVTWSALASMVGNKASGGSFNAARKALRESGLIIEEGEVVRSATPPRDGLSRTEAIELWRAVLANPAPRMIAALDGESLSRDQLGSALGMMPRGGFFNSGVAQLLRNGVARDRSGVLYLAKPLPGERP